METIKFYEAFATEYDQRYYSTENEENKALATHLLTAIQNIQAKEIIEFGCGTGYWLQTIANTGVKRIVGVDQSKEMLDIAKQHLESYPFIDLLQGDITKPFTLDQFFDFAIINFVLSAIEPSKIEQVFNNIYCTLKDEGILFLVENKQPFESLDNVYELTISEPWGSDTVDITYRLYDPVFLSAIIERAGLNVLSLIDLNDDMYILIAQKSFKPLRFYWGN